MKFKSFLIILLICIIFSLSFVSATDNVNITSDIVGSNSNDELSNPYSDMDSIDFLDSSLDEDNVCEGDVEVEKSKTIYVGHHNRTEGGNGSYDNPYTTFKAACDDVNGEDNVTVYVFGGEYKLGEGMVSGKIIGNSYPLIFNTSNLNIVGIDGSVIIKNFNTVKKAGFAEAFSLTSTSGNFTFSNLIFDATDAVSVFLNEDDPYKNTATYFFPFFGQANQGIFNNCSFKGFGTSRIAQTLMYNPTFIGCYFEWNKNYLFQKITNVNVCFESCVFNVASGVMLSLYFHNTCNVSMKNIWFGKNSFAFAEPGPTNFYPNNEKSNVISVTRYANLTVTQNYLGNDEYKIIGKLTWNGTDDQDGMENFQPMDVTLLSENGGEFAPSTVKLVNGTFETIYKNSASTHQITAILHKQDKDLVFYTVNITAKEASINYGDEQNIKVNLSQVINNNVTIVVSNEAYNKTYVYEVNGTDSFNFTIPKTDELKAGTYNITITLNENNLYGIGTTTLTVSKVSDYKFDVVPSEVKFGGTETITVTLPDDVDGTVTVQFGNETQSSPAKSLMTFNFIDLKVMNYDVNVTYSGNDKYISKRIPATVTVNKADSGLEINDTVFAYGENINIPFTPINANGVTVSVLNEDDEEVNTTSSNTNMITLGTLPVGEYTLELTTVVDKDGNYDRITKLSKLTITKTTPSMNVSAETVESITINDNITLTVKLPSDATGNVIIKGNGKKLYNVSANETLTFKISPSAGDYVVDIVYSGDSNYESDMETKEFIISKAETSITANPIAFEEGNSSTIEVNIPNVDSGIIFVDVADKKFYGDINAGRATVLINGLPAGNYTAKISFAGDEKFKPTDRTVDVNVTAAPDIIGELNEIIKNQTNQIAALNNTVNAQNNTIKNQTDEIAALNNTVNAQNQIIETQKDQINNLITPKMNTTIVVDKTFTRAAVDAGAGEKGEMFYAILKDANGNILVSKTVQIAYNGEIYNKITDSQGRVGLQINLAKAGTYPITISFAGDDTYNASPLTLAKLTVTKKKTTIKASNKAFKAKKKSKKISVTLKTVKNEYDKKTYLKSGKKITLKVKGKTYTAKTNKKGVTKFTIKLTKKGKYTAKIKFAGDDTYKASSKTIKIRIK